MNVKSANVVVVLISICL